jgi:hypothetical protein
VRAIRSSGLRPARPARPVAHSLVAALTGAEPAGVYLTNSVGIAREVVRVRLGLQSAVDGRPLERDPSTATPEDKAVLLVSGQHGKQMTLAVGDERYSANTCESAGGWSKGVDRTRRGAARR